MKRISLLTALCLIIMTKKSPAPIYGTFENLTELIDRAEFVVVAEIIKRPAELDMGNGGVFEVEFSKAIKGDIKEGRRSTAYLRDLWFDLGPNAVISLTHEFIQGQLYLLFLNKYTGSPSFDDKSLSVEFVNENCSGDAVWISPLLWHLDLESLKGKGVRESVVALLDHTANENRRFATAVGAMIESRAGAAATQKVTQVLWFDNNAEEAAKFYVSILKDARRQSKLPQYRDFVPGKGNVGGVKFWIEGQEFIALNGGPEFKPTKATVLALNCDTQEEIDYYWEKLSPGGEKSRGGWIRDKFGVSWHILPTGFAQMLEAKIPPRRSES